MDKKGKDWSFLTKTGFGIFVLGICVAVLALGGLMSKEGKGQVGVWVIFLSALFMTLGEVVFSPLGNSFISKYAPKSLLGTLLGVWPLIIFFSGLIYGPLYNFMDKFDFIKAYGLLAVIILVIGILLMPFGKKFNKWIHADEL